MPQPFNFIEAIKQIPDYRKSKGKRHQLWVVLMLILLGTMSGYRGYRPLADFSRENWSTLCHLLALPTDTPIPSYSTFRRVLIQVSFEPFVTLFNQWAQAFLELDEQTWVAVDGKSIKSTVSHGSESYQNFVSTVSAFTHQTGVVLNLKLMENKKTSEIETGLQVIEALAGQPIVFTFDALHTQKKQLRKLSISSNTI